MKKIFTVTITLTVILFFSTAAFTQSYDPAADLSQYKTASELYNYTQVLFVQIARPNQISLYLERGTIGESLRKFDIATKEFERRYPDDPRLPSLRMIVADRDALKPALGFFGVGSMGSDGKQVISVSVDSPVSVKKLHPFPPPHVVEKLQRD
ncbi:MAG: hypothetical protein ABI443_07165 [Chthoniobacterales bacterium]